ncbi:MAG: TonB-dependent receptor [bacterium]
MKLTRNLRSKPCSSVAVLVVAGVLCTGNAVANVLEEITVTAQKREQDLQDVGIAITAFSGDQFRALGFTNTIDISAQTPGLNITDSTTTNVNIRGVAQSDFADHYEPPIASYVDGAYVSSMGAANVQAFDLQRVEVLRGPQGTLFGRNATGGLMHFVSEKPSEEFDAFVELTVAEYDQVRLEGAVGGALTESVTGRLSAVSNQHDGWMENRIGDDLNDADGYAVRGQLLFDLGETTDLWLKAHYSEDDENGTGYSHQPNGFRADGFGVLIGRNEPGTFLDASGNPFQTCAGCDAHGYREADNDSFKGSFDEEGYLEREISGATVKLTVDMEAMTLTSITDYFTMDRDYRDDTEGSPRTNISFYTDQEVDQFSQELRLNGDSDRLHWTAGLYYLDIDNDTASGLDPWDAGPFLAPVNPETGQPLAFIPVTTGFVANTKTESWAVFGHLEYDLSDEVGLIGALRYTEDEREADYTLSSVGDALGPPQTFSKDTTPLAEQDFDNYAYKLQVNWKPNEDILLYASVNRGHKAGSFSYVFLSFAPLDFSNIPHDEEVLTSYEAGYKGDFWDGRARLNANIFYYDYEDHQASFFENLSNTIGNIDATAFGGEIELTVNATENLEFMLGASYLDTEAEDVGLPDGSIQDRELAFAPDYTLNGLIRYTWPLAAGDISAQLDGNYVDDFCFSVVCHPSEEVDAYGIANARLTYTDNSDQWSVALFVRNLADEEYRAYGLDSAFVGFMTNLSGAPRWWGATATYKW